ncbi:MAG: glycosyltransferase [Patescibacteria group bacterium]|nr:glycosyltransferase [Patescibacteria group bacterium]
MRILMISDHADPLAEIGSKEAGGQNIYVYNLSLLLARAGFHVDVFTRWDKKNKREVIKINHHLRIIRVKAGPKKYMPRDNFLKVLDQFRDNIMKRIETENLYYDVIHTNYWFSGLAGTKIAKKLKIPQAHIHHSIGRMRYDILKKYKLQKQDYHFFQIRMRSEKKIADSSSIIIASSPVEQKYIKSLFKIGKEKIAVIPIGVDLKYFHPQKFRKKKVERSEGEKIILYVGRIEWRKGISTLLYAMREVLGQHPKAKLLIIGGGRTKSARELEQSEIERQAKIIKELNLENKVFYLGPKSQKELSYYYNLADVCVVPSYYEPFGIVPLEAMACGTPVVATKTGGLQYTIKNNSTGHLVKPRNFKDLSKKISLVLNRGKGYYSKNCLLRINKNFTWEEIVKRYAVFLEQLALKKEIHENRDTFSVRRICSSGKVRWNRASRL